MAQWIRSWPLEHEDQSSDPHNPPAVVLDICNSSAPTARGRDMRFSGNSEAS